ncbi:MAG: hypothetical protein ACYC7D_01640 [Nitrososphaerales archaeon]
MASKETAEDAGFIFYLLPLVASIVYGAYEWYIMPHSTSMPGLAYLIVSKSPYLFLFSIICVCLGLILELRGTMPMNRSLVLLANVSRMQLLAVAVLALSFAAAISVGGYNVGNGASVFIAGRYALIFAFGLIMLSVLIAPRQLFGTARMSSAVEIIGLLLLGAAPVVLYTGVKLHIHFNYAVLAALVTALIGLYLFFNNTKLFTRKQTVQQKPVPNTTAS